MLLLTRLALTDLKVKINLGTELRDSIDMYQRDMDVAKFFDLLLPCFINILKNGKPAFTSTSADNVSLGIMSRRRFEVQRSCSEVHGAA